MGAVEEGAEVKAVPEATEMEGAMEAEERVTEAKEMAREVETGLAGEAEVPGWADSDSAEEVGEGVEEPDVEGEGMAEQAAEVEGQPSTCPRKIRLKPLTLRCQRQGRCRPQPRRCPAAAQTAAGLVAGDCNL